MKRLILTVLSAVALSAIASPSLALTERFDRSFRDNLDKGLTTETKLSDRQQDAFEIGTVRLTERFDDAFRRNLDKGLSVEINLSDRHRDEFKDGLYRLTDRFNDERESTLNR